MNNNIFTMEKPPARPKKISGTRFSAILGKDDWKSDFEVWCDITKFYPSTFEGNKYTEAGKVIEPKIHNYLKEVYGFDLEVPEDVWGEDPFSKTWGNFFDKSCEPFGGMWDAINWQDGKRDAVVEIKTTSRPQDWLNGSPEYYALQASLYAYLLGLDNVIMVVAFLEEPDYAKPEHFKPNGGNVYIEEFKISERFPKFQEYVDEAKRWYDNYVLTGISPQYDLTRKNDKEIVEEIMTEYLNPEEDLNVIIKEAEKLQKEVDKELAKIKPKEKRLKELKDLIKEQGISIIGNKDKVVIQGDKFEWSVSKSMRRSAKYDELENAGLQEYIQYNESYTLRNKEVK